MDEELEQQKRFETKTKSKTIEISISQAFL